MAMEVDRDRVIGLLGELGYHGAGKWPEGRLGEVLQAIPDNLQQGTLTEPESDEAKSLLEEILNASEREDSILIKANGHVKKKEIPQEEEEDMAEVAELEETEEEVEEPQEETEEKPRKRGRPKGSGKAKEKKEKKPKKVKEPKEEVSYEVPHSFVAKELEKPKLVKITKKLAEEFKDMTRFPRDRELQENRLNSLRRAFEKNEFRGCEWVSAYCEEDKNTYRINGRHTSHVACEYFSNGREVGKDIVICVRRYTCPTMEDVAHLHASYDPKWSARNKLDTIRVFAASNPRIASLEPRQLSVITSGISFARWETSYRKVTPEDQAALLLKNAEFAQWVGQLLETKSKDDRERYKHLIRMSCVAAMWHCYQKDQEAANEFWEAVRDDCNDDKNAPRRKLYKWLKEHKVGAREAKERVGEREVYVYCLQAWNAWREGEDLKFSYKKESKSPVAV